MNNNQCVLYNEKKSLFFLNCPRLVVPLHPHWRSMPCILEQDEPNIGLVAQLVRATDS